MTPPKWSTPAFPVYFIENMYHKLVTALPDPNTTHKGYLTQSGTLT